MPGTILYIPAHECIRNSKCEFFKIRKKLRSEVKMKRFVLPLLLSIMFGIFFPFASLPRTLGRYNPYTGSVKGNIDPLHT